MNLVMTNVDDEIQLLNMRREAIVKLKKELVEKTQEFDRDVKAFMERAFNLKPDEEFHILQIVDGARKLK